MKKNKKKNRRGFIKEASAGAAGFMIVPRHVLGGKGFTAPSDKLNLAAIGAGGKGGSDIWNSYANGENNVVALADIDTKNAARSIERFPKAKFYKDFRIMLNEMHKDIDAVTVSTPDHVHGIAANMAIQRGMHVYVQKPLTHNIYEARKLTEAAREYKVVTQMGNQGASHPGQEQLAKWFAEGHIGKVHTVNVWTNRPVWPQGIPEPSAKTPLPDHLSKSDWDLYIGPAEHVDYHPLYHTFKWRGWWNFGTGALGDMGCHLMDVPFRMLHLGYPTEVECSVGAVYTRDWSPEYIPGGCPPSSSVQLSFNPTDNNDSKIKFTWSDGGIRPFHPDLIPADHPIGDNDSTNGVMMIGEKGVLTSGTYGMVPKMYLNDGTLVEMDENFESQNKYLDKPESGHQYAWQAACKAGFNSDEHKALTSSFDYAGPMTETVLMGNLAIRSHSLSKLKDSGHRDYYGRRKLLWDGENTRITNFEEANQFVDRPYRTGWKYI